MKPIVAVTMGDPAGIGPEVLCRAAGVPAVRRACQVLAIGDAHRLGRAMGICGLTRQVRALRRGEDASYRDDDDALNCLEAAHVPDDLEWGAVDARAGEAAFRCVQVAAQLARDGTVGAICTAPLNKQALHLAGHPYSGHTELLAALTGTVDYAMLLTCPRLRVVHVTTHVGLLDAVEQITPERVRATLRLGVDGVRHMGVAQPRVGVCGFNPHAGESGLFGRGEEEQRILPAVLAAKADGLCVDGPLAADALFARAVGGQFDLVVAMYHDQGHIPIKVLGWDSGVNITLGLPFIRTSVDHGTAFDIAGRGSADPRSMVAALVVAADLARRRGIVPR